MSKRIFYISYQLYVLECAKVLQRELQWEPVYWITDGDFEEEVKKYFPVANTHHYPDAIKGKSPAFLPEEKWDAVDNSLLLDLSFHESVALNMMNRNYLTDFFSYQERSRLYLRLVSFCSSLLNRLKPDYIFMEDTPHQAFDYLLYAIAQHKGIKTILFETTSVPEYFSPMSQFDKGSTAITEAYQRLINANVTSYALSQSTSDGLVKIKGDYQQALPYYMVQQVEDFKQVNSNRAGKKVLDMLLMPVKLLNLSKFRKRWRFLLSLKQVSSLNYYKQENKSLEESATTKLSFLLQVRKLKKIKSENLKYYKSISSQKIDLNIPYIYCTLHFQPEKSTCPWGGYYTNQLLMINLLAKTVPHGWKVYVKDHISQFIYPATGEPTRSKEFYDDICKLPNVAIVPLEMLSFDLIDHAQAVATVAGSVLWEAVVRSKPAFAFGIGYHSWLVGCEGIFYTPDRSSLQEALRKVQSGYKVDFEKIRLYCHTIETVAYKGYVGGAIQANNSGITPEQNGLVHAQAVKDFIAQTP